MCGVRTRCAKSRSPVRRLAGLVDGAGHFPQLEQPVHFARVLIDIVGDGLLLPTAPLHRLDAPRTGRGRRRRGREPRHDTSLRAPCGA